MPQKLSALPVGTLIKDTGTTYYGQPIIWKIADQNHEGYPTNSTTLITDKIIKITGFDGAEAENANEQRKTHGNNRYRTSNIRQWLNSEEDAGNWWTAQNLDDDPTNTNNHDAPPSRNNLNPEDNGYDILAGFLTNFSYGFKSSLLETTLNVGRNTATDGGGSEIVVDKIFLASAYEVGINLESSAAEGSKLAVFSNNESRKAYSTDSSTSLNWYLRSAQLSESDRVCGVGNNGYMTFISANASRACGIRPLCNISSETLVSDTADTDGVYTIVPNESPSAPTTITIPTTIYTGSSFKVSWGESTDPEGTLSGYKLERSINGGEWTQIYTGPMLAYTDTAETGVDALQYRVKAFDTEGAESAYKESEIVTISSAPAPTDSDSKLVNFESLKRFYQNLDPSSSGSTGGGATKVKLLGDCAVGDIVYINENNVGREYVVIQKGNPDSSIYDASCDGIWLMKEMTYNEYVTKWDSRYGKYDTSILNNLLHIEFLGSLDVNIRNSIKAVKIPFMDFNNSAGVLRTGDQGLLCKVFVLSPREVGISNTSITVVGSRLSYFLDGTDSSANIIRRCNPGLTSNRINWWLRVAMSQDSATAYYIATSGSYGSISVNTSTQYYARPVFILPPTLYVDSDGYVTP